MASRYRLRPRPGRDPAAGENEIDLPEHNDDELELAEHNDVELEEQNNENHNVHQATEDDFWGPLLKDEEKRAKLLRAPRKEFLPEDIPHTRSRIDNKALPPIYGKTLCLWKGSTWRF